MGNLKNIYSFDIKSFSCILLTEGACEGSICNSGYYANETLTVAGNFAADTIAEPLWSRCVTNMKGGMWADGNIRIQLMSTPAQSLILDPFPRVDPNHGGWAKEAASPKPQERIEGAMNATVAPFTLITAGSTASCNQVCALAFICFIIMRLVYFERAA